jgi:hypothetical protein
MENQWSQRLKWIRPSRPLRAMAAMASTLFLAVE